MLDVYPDFDAVGGRSTLIAIVGALLTITLIVAVLMLIICAIVWAVSSSTGDITAATRGRAGVFVSIGAAALAGAGVAWLNLVSRGNHALRTPWPTRSSSRRATSSSSSSKKHAGGAWIYHADPDWSPSAAIVFPERILLRITPAAGDAGYVWGVEEWDGRDQNLPARPRRHRIGGDAAEMIGIASSFIDEENIGEPLPVTAYPLAEELAERITAGYPDAHWRSYVNSAYGNVLEYPERRRLTFRDEANFMGSIDGYTWMMECSWNHQQSSVEVKPFARSSGSRAGHRHQHLPRRDRTRARLSTRSLHAPERRRGARGRAGPGRARLAPGDPTHRATRRARRRTRPGSHRREQPTVRHFTNRARCTTPGPVTGSGVSAPCAMSPAPAGRTHS